MLRGEESPVELPALLFQPQTENPPGDDLDLLHPAMGRPAQHHNIRQHVVPLRAAGDVVDLAVAASATMQQVAQFAAKHILGVFGE
jgi:hypothetical protein